jgi:NAD(P)-dependent dehydrogenase (short-subunit alcohol dehydrogenase family)
MFQSNLLCDKRILITGGGTGLGKGMAHRFLELGATVYICGRRTHVLSETETELSGVAPGKIRSLPCDIRDLLRVEQMIDSIWEDGPPIPVAAIVNLAENVDSLKHYQTALWRDLEYDTVPACAADSRRPVEIALIVEDQSRRRIGSVVEVEPMHDAVCPSAACPRGQLEDHATSVRARVVAAGSRCPVEITNRVKHQARARRASVIRLGKVIQDAFLPASVRTAS